MKRECGIKGVESGAASSLWFTGAALEHVLFIIKQKN